MRIDSIRPIDREQVRILHDAIVDNIGRSESEWARWPGGWPDEIDTALIDAILSARAIYITGNGEGIRNKVVIWRDSREPNWRHNLEDLRDEIENYTPVWNEPQMVDT